MRISVPETSKMVVEVQLGITDANAKFHQATVKQSDVYATICGVEDFIKYDVTRATVSIAAGDIKAIKTTEHVWLNSANIVEVWEMGVIHED